jgi:hypothetical protein
MLRHTELGKINDTLRQGPRDETANDDSPFNHIDDTYTHKTRDTSPVSITKGHGGSNPSPEPTHTYRHRPDSPNQW